MVDGWFMVHASWLTVDGAVLLLLMLDVWLVGWLVGPLVGLTVGSLLIDDNCLIPDIVG